MKTIRGLFLLFLFLSGQHVLAADGNNEWRRIIDLRGQWAFSIGDNPNWKKYDFDDGNWESIFAPSAWEEEGYPGYDGYAWYRKSFKIKRIDENLYVHLGRIDDVDEVYLNGRLIGASGESPPHFVTAYQKERVYHIPASLLKLNEKNILAIRVYDDQLAGGILDGRLGVYLKQNNPVFIKSFSGYWLFKPGDSVDYKEPEYDDSQWSKIIVPLNWEHAGYPNYDGYAWYRLHFDFDMRNKDEYLVLLLGKIDDIDEAYLNGRLIGKTGHMYRNTEDIRVDREWSKLRAYRIQKNDLHREGNLIAIRVYDAKLDGGIYEGPIGLMSLKNYRASRWQTNGKNTFFWDWFHN